MNPYRSWTTYVIPELGLELTCHQVSPFLPGDYADSCLPATVFSWSVKNKSDKNLVVTIALSFVDGWGKTNLALDPKAEGSNDKDVAAKLIHQTFR